MSLRVAYRRRSQNSTLFRRSLFPGFACVLGGQPSGLADSRSRLTRSSHRLGSILSAFGLTSCCIVLDRVTPSLMLPPARAATLSGGRPRSRVNRGRKGSPVRVAVLNCGDNAVRSLPHLSQFESADEYYAVLFHELAHNATGAPRRLNRFAEAEGDRVEKYSFEELVAEFGAAFLCGFAGIQNPDTEAMQASYIEGWARVFRQDSRILIRAASAAQRAADYIRGKVTVEQPTPAGQPRRPPRPEAGTPTGSGLIRSVSPRLSHREAALSKPRGMCAIPTARASHLAPF